MPRVCHVSTMTRWGGIERMLVDMLLNVGPSGFSHFLIATSSTQELLDPLLKAGIPNFEPRRRIHYDPGAIKQMAHWLRENNIDVVHGYNSIAGTWGSLAATFARTKILVGGEHGTAWSVRPPYFWFNLWAYKAAKVIVANSNASRLMINRRFGIPQEKIKVIYNAVPSYSDQLNTERNIDLPFIDKSSLIVGSVGHLTPIKNYGILVEAAALAIKQNRKIVFVLVGGGEQEAFLRMRIQELGIGDRFFLTGPRSDARKLIRKFDIFVSTSLQEAFGNVLVEAALAGKAVIAPAIDGIPEAVSDDETGWLIEPTDPIDYKTIANKKLPRKGVIAGQLRPLRSLNPSTLAEAILAMAESPTQRDEYGEKGSQRAKELFGIHRYLNELEATYASLI